MPKIPSRETGPTRIMGIDPGTICVGYGVVEKNGSRLAALDFGAIRPSSGLSLPERLRVIFEKLTSVVQLHRPQVIVIEDVFSGKGAKSSIKIGEGRGIALLCAAMASVPVAEYTATSVKMSVVGNGHATKAQVQNMVKVLLQLSEVPTPEDASDALAIAICHCHKSSKAGLTI